MKKFRFSFTILIIISNFTLINRGNAQLTGGWIEQQFPPGNGLNDVKFFDINNGIIVGENGRILKTTNSGLNWIIITSGTNNNLRSLSIASPSVVYAAGDSGVILKSIDSGNSWITQNSQTTYNLNSIVFKSSNIGFAGGNKGTILRTTNSGLNWIGTFSDTSARFYSMSYVNDNFIWAVGQKSSAFPVGIPIMMKSTNMGINWNEQTNELYQGTSIFFLDTLLGFSLNCSTVLDYGILRTSNSGVNWECQWGGFKGPYKTFFINNLTGYTVGYAQGSYAITKTTNSGIDWQYSSTAFIYLDLRSVFFINSETGWTVGNTILKTTNGGGSIPTLITSIEETPSEFSLYQNYPNPFNPITKIKFDIPKSSLTMLSVYNSEGKLIETLYNDNLEEGSYEINFDGSKYPSGIYFYRLETNGYTFSKKMILLK